MSDPDMHVEIAEHANNSVVLTPEGPRILWDNVEQLQKAFEEAKETSRPNVILNLAQVDLIDSVGLGSIISGKRLLGSEFKMQLCSLSASVQEVFRRTRLDLIFPIHNNLDRALESLKSSRTTNP